MGPRLEHLTGVPQPCVEPIPLVHAEAAVDGQVVRAADGLHRVQLQQAESPQRPPEVPDVDPASRRAVAEPLGGQRDASGRPGVEPDRFGAQMPSPRPPRKGSRSSNSASRSSVLATNASPMSEGWNIPACQVAMWSRESAVEWSRV